MNLLLLMTDSEEGTIVLLVIFGLLAIGFIYYSIQSSIDKKENQKLVVNTLKPKLGTIDSSIYQELLELSKWVNNCEKCGFMSFYIKQLEETKLVYTCNKCGKNKTLKFDNTFYKIDSIPKLNNFFQEMIYEMNKHKLPLKYVESKRNDYEWNKPISDFLDELKHDYFTFNYYKKHTNWKPDCSNLSFFSNGTEIDKVSKQLEKKKISKLSPNRKLLDKKVIKEWNYKRITTGQKGEIIKKWAKKSGLECIDGRKCGGVKFNSLPNKEITFGHIVPQSWAVEYPHMIETVHHPDNLYLTCKSCNSSLNSDFPDPELKNKISKREGTIGDWLRTHLNEF